MEPKPRSDPARFVALVPARAGPVLADRAATGLRIATYRDSVSLLSAAEAANIVWLDPGDVTPAHAGGLVEAAHGLQWLHTTLAGINNLPLQRLHARRIAVTNGVGLYGQPIAEHVMAGLLALSRRLPELLRAQIDHQWSPGLAKVEDLDGSTAMIIGFGDVGRAIAARVSAFGVSVIGCRRGESNEPGVLGGERWRDALPQADIVILTVPLTPRTEHLIGRTEVGRMKPGAVLINVARGGVVDESALLDGLLRGHLGGAVLDCFEDEPLPPSNMLWDLPNVVITPHIAWESSRFEARSLELFAANLDRFLRGESLVNVVDLVDGY